MDKSEKNALRAKYFEIMKARFELCLEPAQNCKNRTIRSHSIQNGRILDQLAVKGHVITLNNASRTGTPDPTFVRIGRNQASVFTGLCAHHDQEIFRDIDVLVPDLEIDKCRFLLAYRSVLREYHAVATAACQIQAMYMKRVELGLSPGGRPDRAGLTATSFLSNWSDSYLYKREFDEVLLAERWETVCHQYFSFDTPMPSIAVSTLFSLDDMDWPDDVARIALNVYPNGRVVVVLFSYLMRDRSVANAFLDRILTADGYYKQYLLSKMILQHAENFVMSPAYFEIMEPSRIEAIKKFFCATIEKNEHEHEDSNLFLF